MTGSMKLYMLHFIGFPFWEWHIAWIRHCSLSLVFSHLKWNRIRWTSLMFRRPCWGVCTRPRRCGYIGTGWIHISRFFTISTPISFIQFFKAPKSKFGLCEQTLSIKVDGLLFESSSLSAYTCMGLKITDSYGWSWVKFHPF